MRHEVVDSDPESLSDGIDIFDRPRHLSVDPLADIRASHTEDLAKLGARDPVDHEVLVERDAEGCIEGEPWSGVSPSLPCARHGPNVSNERRAVKRSADKDALGE